MDWFLYDRNLCHERVKLMQSTQENSKSFLLYIHEKIYANLFQIKINKTTKFLASMNKIKIQLQMLHKTLSSKLFKRLIHSSSIFGN